MTNLRLVLGLACALAASCSRTELPGPSLPADPCAPNPCAEPHRGVCAVSSAGAAVCSCDDGYWDTGECVPAVSCTPNPCSATPHKTACAIEGQSATCACEAGWRDDGAGGCVKDDPCDPNPCAAPHRTACRAAGEATVVCACDDGYWDTGECVEALSCTPNPCTAPHKSVCSLDGQTVRCGCEVGYREDASGRCVLLEPCDPNPCSEPHRTVCRATTATTATCSCDPGYWDLGSCEPAASCTPNPCTAPHKTQCAVVDFAAACACDPGWRDDGAGGCELDDPCDPSPCDEPHRSRCYASGSAAVCSCDEGYWDVGTCVEAVSCDPNPCTAPHKTRCVIEGQTAACACDAGYRDDGGGGCAPIDPCAPNPCARPHQTVCRAYGSTAVCSCDAGYRLDSIGNCVEACNPNPCTAPHQSLCTVATGGYKCKCDAGYFQNTSGGGCQYAPPPDCLAAHDSGDAFEPDECPSLAKLVSLPSAAAHGIDPVADVDWIAFDAREGQAYVVDVSSAIALDISVRDASGNQVLAASSALPNALRSLAVRTGPGRFLVRLAATAPDSTGAYSISIAEHADDLANTAAMAGEIPLETTARGTIDYGSDEDWVAFQGAARHIVQVTAISQGQLKLQLWDAAGAPNPVGTPLASGSNSGFNYPSMSATLPQDGTYYVRIVPGSGATLPSYTIAIHDTGPDDHGDTAAQATEVTLGRAYAGDTQYSQDQDWVSFSVPPGHVFRISVQASSASWFLFTKLYDSRAVSSSSPPVLYSFGGTGVLNYVSSSVAPYYIDFAGGTSPGTYSFTIEDLGWDDHGDTRMEATELLPGGSVTAVSHYQDKDWFLVPGAPGRVHSVTCTAGAFFTVYAEDGTTQLASGGGRLELSTWGSGAYVMVFDGHSLRNFTLGVSEIGTDDRANSAGQALLTPLGVRIPGALEFGGDLDWFAVALDGSHVYRLTLVPSGSSLAMRLVSTNGTTVLASTTASTQTELRARAPATGKYFVSVGMQYATNPVGGYVLLVEDLGLDDHGDTAAGASALAVGSDTSGEVQFGGDVDFFGLPALAGHEYRVTVTPLGFNARASLLDVDAKTVLANQTSFFTPFTKTFRASSSAPYYLSVSAASTAGIGAYVVLLEDLGTPP